MKHSIQLFAAVCCLFSAGCHSEKAITKENSHSLAPNDTFHLSVEPVIAQSELTVSLLKIHVKVHPPQDIFIQLDNAQTHGLGVAAGNPAGAADRDAQIVFSASRLAPEVGHSPCVQTFMRAESFGNSANAGPSLTPVPAGTALDTYFSISATSGDYKLDTPVEIGRLAGQPITLIVGKPPKMRTGTGG